MGKYKDEHGQTRLGAFLQNAAPEVLELAGDLTGINALTKVGKLIDKDPKMSVEDKQTAKDLLEIEIQDRDSARQMQIAALQQKDLFSKRYIYYLGGGSAFLLFIILILLIFIEVPEGNKAIVYMTLGTMIGFVSGVYTFHFGSSQGSREKQSGLDKAIDVLKGGK